VKKPAAEKESDAAAGGCRGVGTFFTLISQFYPQTCQAAINLWMGVCHVRKQQEQFYEMNISV